MSVPTEKIPVLEKVTGPATIRYGKVPKIHLPGSGGQLQREFNTHVGQALVGKCLYRRGKRPYNVAFNELGEMMPTTFVSWATQFFAPYRTRTDKDGEPVHQFADMTEQVAKHCLNSLEFREALPPINRIYPSPVPLMNNQDQLILCTPGYEPSSGTYIHTGPLLPQPPDPARPPLTHMVSSEGYYKSSTPAGKRACSRGTCGAERNTTPCAKAGTPSLPCASIPPAIPAWATCSCATAPCAAPSSKSPIP